MGVIHSTQPIPSRDGIRISASKPQVRALNQQAGNNSEMQAQCSTALQAHLGCRAAREEAHSCCSPSAFSPHSRNTQPGLITVAGACEMALTPQKCMEGPACGYLQSSEPPLWKGSFCTRTTGSCTMSCPRALASSCQHRRSSLRS